MPEIHARYAATAALDRITLEAALGLLSADERARAERFAFSTHRREYIAAHALLRGALSEWHPMDPGEWRFVAGPGGKPQLADAQASATQLSFNLTHTDGLVACAIGRGGRIGIDVEAIDRRTDTAALADRYFSPAERVALARAGDEQGRRFIEIWTLKEAFVKATGAGVTRALDAFSFAVDETFSVTFEPPPGESAALWQFAMFAPLEPYRIAVAVNAETPDPCAITAAPFDLATLGAGR